MFIRIKTTPNSTKKAIQIVRSIRQGDKVRQQIVRHVGWAHDEGELARLRDLAEYIKAGLIEKQQPTLFPADKMAQMAVETRQKRLAETEHGPLNVNLKKLREEHRVVAGIHEVYGQVFGELGFDSVFGPPSRHVARRQMLRHLTMARIANPGSKRESVRLLERDFGVTLSLDAVYRLMDKIDDVAISKIKGLASRAATGLLKQKITVLFYDCTTLYFESFTQDDLKQNGFSKDNKHNQPQVLLGLIVTREGLPLSYEVFAGSTYEGHTMEEAVKNIGKQYTIDKVVLVADSGLLNKANTQRLENSKKPYILGARLKNLPKAVTQKVLEATSYVKANGDHYEKLQQIKLSDNQTLIVSYSEKRAEKDRHDRQKAVEQLQKKLDKSASPSSLLNNFGYKKFLKVEGAAQLVVDEQKMKEAAKWDGLHGVITNIKKPNSGEILEHYHGLWQIEETFRISKHDLRIRPIFHWTPQRIKAHLALCFTALVCVRMLTYRVASQYQPLSPEVIRNELVHVQLSILRNIDTNNRYCLPSALSKHARKIYQLMGLKIDQTPYLLR